MITRRNSLLLKYFYTRSIWNHRVGLSSYTPSQFTKDLASLFFDKSIQNFLRTLTRIEYDRTFRIRKDGTPLTPPKFQFMTEEELNQHQSAAMLKARKRLQMPPVVNVTPDTVQVISEDPTLQDYDELNYVFTDISFGISNKSRLIVVREPNGRLRHAQKEEKRRINQVYFPIKGRELHVPKMFYDPYFNDLLEREEYEYVLDRACLQFEPDDEEYHRITNQVYLAVNEKKKFDTLRSTRHFGPLAFYLAVEKTIDDLLVDVLESGRLEEAVALVKLYQSIHSDCRSGEDRITTHGVDLVKCYAKKDSRSRNRVEHAILVYQKLKEERVEVAEGVKRAHGLDATNAQETNKSDE